jgi:hypothetical protein
MSSFDLSPISHFLNEYAYTTGGQVKYFLIEKDIDVSLFRSSDKPPHSNICNGEMITRTFLKGEMIVGVVYESRPGVEVLEFPESGEWFLDATGNIIAVSEEVLT